MAFAMQYVENTDAAKDARKVVTDKSDRDAEIDENSGSRDATESDGPAKRKRSDDKTEQGDKVEATFIEEERDSEDLDGDGPVTKKSKADNEVGKGTGKDDEGKDENDDLGQPCSLERLPEKGMTVHWRVASGWCEGEFFRTFGVTIRMQTGLIPSC